MSEIMKIIDERETQKAKTKTEKNEGDGSYSERVRAKWFCCAFKLGFLQLICKGSLIFKSNLELALSIVLKERELYMSKHVALECRCVQIIRIVILFYMFLNPDFKMMTSCFWQGTRFVKLLNHPIQASLKF